MLPLYNLPDWMMALTIGTEPFQLAIDNMHRWDREVLKPAVVESSHGR